MPSDLVERGRDAGEPHHGTLIPLGPSRRALKGPIGDQREGRIGTAELRDRVGGYLSALDLVATIATARRHEPWHARLRLAPPFAPHGGQVRPRIAAIAKSSICSFLLPSVFMENRLVTSFAPED